MLATSSTARATTAIRSAAAAVRSCSTGGKQPLFSRTASRYSQQPAVRFELKGALGEMEHLRGGLGGMAPMHVNIDSRIIHGFRWVPARDLLVHEEVRPVAASALKAYLESSNSLLPPSIPAIVACSRKWFATTGGAGLVLEQSGGELRVRRASSACPPPRLSISIQ